MECAANLMCNLEMAFMRKGLEEKKKDFTKDGAGVEKLKWSRPAI